MLVYLNEELTVSCCGQHMGNSVASKAFIREELEVLIKNSHGCSMSVSDWLAGKVLFTIKTEILVLVLNQ